MAVSPTLAINEEVSRRRRDGRAVLPLGFGEAGLPVHPDLRAVLAEAAGRGGYGPVAGGEPLRAAAAGYWRRRGLATDPDLVVAGPGSKALLYALLDGIGGDVALPRPSWVSYAAQAALLARRTWPVPTPAGRGGVPDPGLLAKAALGARAAGRPLGSVVLTLPDNPTGRVADLDAVRGVCEVAREHDLAIVADEIYRDLVHDPATPLPAPAMIAPERTVTTTALSKSLAVGGWRLGVARLPDSQLGRQLHDRLTTAASELWSCPAQPVEEAAAWAFDEPVQLRMRVEASRRLHARVARAAARVFAAAGAIVQPPQAAFYLYPDLEAHRGMLARRWSVETGPDLARLLLERHDVAVLPASAFGDPERCLRLRVATGLLYGDTDEQREEALAHPAPETLPWIAASLHRLGRALYGLTGSVRAARPCAT